MLRSLLSVACLLSGTGAFAFAFAPPIRRGARLTALPRRTTATTTSVRAATATAAADDDAFFASYRWEPPTDAVRAFVRGDDGGGDDARLPLPPPPTSGEMARFTIPALGIYLAGPVLFFSRLPPVFGAAFRLGRWCKKRACLLQATTLAH